MSKVNLGKKGLIFQLIACSPSSRELRAGTGGRNYSRSQGEVLLTGLLSLLSYSTHDSELPHTNTSIINQDLSTGKSGGGNLSVEVPSSQMTRAFVNLGHKNGQHSDHSFTRYF